ncbi:MAG: RsmE family RNA methyltransferase [Polyangiales bacterium]
MRRLPLGGLTAGPRTLDASSSRYLARVLRLRAGDRFEAFDPRAGTVSDAKVLEVTRDVLVELGPVRAEAPEEPLILVQGYPKGDKLADIVRDATELGATLIIPAICARSVARPDESKAASRAERLANVAAEAARQCGRARAPEIAAPMPLADALDIARAQAAHRYLLWEKATDRLVFGKSEGGTAFVIGPEGGLTDLEAKAEGFEVCSLGSTVLRTETAATAVLGAYRVLVG